MTVEHQHPALQGKDRRLVDLLTSVLTNPNIHTDTRMRLHEEIGEILRSAHDDIHGAAGKTMHQRALDSHAGQLPDLLGSVLVDPALHTDLRMRLHEEIGEILAAARPASRV